MKCRLKIHNSTPDTILQLCPMYYFYWFKKKKKDGKSNFPNFTLREIFPLGFEWPIISTVLHKNALILKSHILHIHYAQTDIVAVEGTVPASLLWVRTKNPSSLLLLRVPPLNLSSDRPFEQLTQAVISPIPLSQISSGPRLPFKGKCTRKSDLPAVSGCSHIPWAPESQLTWWAANASSPSSSNWLHTKEKVEGNEIPNSRKWRKKWINTIFPRPISCPQICPVVSKALGLRSVLACCADEV